MRKALEVLLQMYYDLAKIGRLYLNGGTWNGKQIVSKEWIDKSLERLPRIKVIIIAGTISIAITMPITLLSMRLVSDTNSFILIRRRM